MQPSLKNDHSFPYFTLLGDLRFTGKHCEVLCLHCVLDELSYCCLCVSTTYLAHYLLNPHCVAAFLPLIYMCSL